MQTIQLRERTGADETLTLRLPVGRPDTEVDVVVVVQTKAAPGDPRPPEYFDLIGSIDDETFGVHRQPPLPPPVEIE